MSLKAGEKNQLIFASEPSDQLLGTSEPTNQMQCTSEFTKQLLCTSETPRQLLVTSEAIKQLLRTSKPTSELLSSSEPPHQLCSSSESASAFNTTKQLSCSERACSKPTGTYQLSTSSESNSQMYYGSSVCMNKSNSLEPVKLPVLSSSMIRSECWSSESEASDEDLDKIEIRLRNGCCYCLFLLHFYDFYMF